MQSYVGMNGKQDGGYIQCISIQTLIFRLLVNFIRPKTLSSALWHCPIFTVAMRLLEIVTKVTNLETVKIDFRHLRFPLLSSACTAPLREQCLDQNTH